MGALISLGNRCVTEVKADVWFKAEGHAQLPSRGVVSEGHTAASCGPRLTCGFFDGMGLGD